MNTVGILGFQAVLKLPGLEYANDAVLQSGQVLKGLSWNRIALRNDETWHAFQRAVTPATAATALANPILKLRLNLKMVHREQQNSGQTV